jgi:hypothetical protein
LPTISQAIGGRISNDVSEDDGQMLANHFKKTGLLSYLVDVEVAAKAATQHVDKSLLERERSQSDQALPNFIFHCSVIWKSLTGRPPSAEKVHRNIRHDGPSDPDFLIFVQELAKSVEIAPPSRNQVATSLRKLRPCD